MGGLIGRWRLLLVWLSKIAHNIIFIVIIIIMIIIIIIIIVIIIDLYSACSFKFRYALH